MLIGKKISFNSLKTNINNIKLPPGYEVLEYIKNNGQTYTSSYDQQASSGYGGVIDTGLGYGLSQNLLKVQSIFIPYQNSNPWWSVLGWDSSDGASDCFSLRRCGPLINRPLVNGSLDQTPVDANTTPEINSIEQLFDSTPQFLINKKYDFTFWNDSKFYYYIINGNQYKTEFSTIPNTNIGGNIYIGAIHRGTFPAWRVGQLYLGIQRFWYNDELIGQFVPCKEISTGKCGMFDTITNTFKTSIHSSYQFSDEQPMIS